MSSRAATWRLHDITPKTSGRLLLKVSWLQLQPFQQQTSLQSYTGDLSAVVMVLMKIKPRRLLLEPGSKQCGVHRVVSTCVYLRFCFPSVWWIYWTAARDPSGGCWSSGAIQLDVGNCVEHWPPASSSSSSSIIRGTGASKSDDSADWLPCPAARSSTTYRSLDKIQIRPLKTTPFDWTVVSRRRQRRCGTISASRFKSETFPRSLARSALVPCVCQSTGRPSAEARSRPSGRVRWPNSVAALQSRAVLLPGIWPCPPAYLSVRPTSSAARSWWEKRA